MMRKFRESIKRPGANDGAAVFEVTAERCGGALAFTPVQPQPRDHLREVPAHFDLCGFSEQPEHLGFVANEEARIFAGDFFDGIGCAYADERIVVPEAADEFSEEFWLFKYELGDFVGAANGASVGTFEH